MLQATPPAATPSAEPSTSEPQSDGAETANSSIRLWWPSPLYPSTNTRAETLLTQRLARYAGGIVSVRVRRSEGLGGIFETLDSAAKVAPSALPDAVLMRAADLPRAYASKIIFPLPNDQMIAWSEYFPSGVALGKFEDVPFGLPYMLNVLHVVYRGEGEPPRQLSTLAARGIGYGFPAKASRGVNLSILHTYISAGGTLTDANGKPHLDRAILESVLTAYQDLYAGGLLGKDAVANTDPNSYWAAVASGDVPLAQVESTYFVAQWSKIAAEDRREWQMAALPNLSSEPSPMSVVDGYFWVLTTPDPVRQARAMSAILWLMETDGLGAFSEAMGMLPGRRSALNAWQDSDYIPFARSLLERPALPLPETLDPRLAAALQSAFEAVLSGTDAEAAAAAAVAQLGN
ncbi:MAG: hypothetical protein OHK0023_02730 [Anaerolineae bacterium]